MGRQSAHCLLVYLPQAELESDGASVIQHDRVDVGLAGRHAFGRNVEDPLLVSGIPTERRVRIRGDHSFVNCLYYRSSYDLYEIEGSHHSCEADGEALRIAYPKLGRCVTACLEHAGAVSVDRLQDLVPRTAVADAAACVKHAVRVRRTRGVTYLVRCVNSEGLRPHRRGVKVRTACHWTRTARQA